MANDSNKSDELDQLKTRLFSTYKLVLSTGNRRETRRDRLYWIRSRTYHTRCSAAARSLVGLGQAPWPQDERGRRRRSRATLASQRPWFLTLRVCMCTTLTENSKCDVLLSFVVSNPLQLITSLNFPIQKKTYLESIEVFYYLR
jgi:hypothetical protein